MFSVKWIETTEHGTIERIYEAEDITIAHRNGAPPPVGSLPQEPPRWEVEYRVVHNALCIIDPHSTSGDMFIGRSFDSGTIYVMNESGATVGKYVLSDKIVSNPQPLQPAA